MTNFSANVQIFKNFNDLNLFIGQSKKGRTPRMTDDLYLILVKSPLAERQLRSILFSS